MALLTLAQYAAALKQQLLMSKTSAHNGTASLWFTYWDATGSPTGATLAVGNTANGLVPTSATAGAPAINFSTGLGYLTGVEWSGSQLSRLMLVDRLFHCGAYSFNSSVTLASQPSYSSRIPNGADYKGLQLWYEQVTTATGAQTATITYTDESGNAAHSTSVTLASGAVAGTLAQVPLALGDTGLQKIESVVGSVASAGTFNLFVARPLWSGRIDIAGQPYTHPIELVGMPQVWADSCLSMMILADTAQHPVLSVALEIASG